MLSTLGFSGNGDAVESAQRALCTRPGRILLCRPNARLGNALLLTPLVQEIERIWPGAELDILSGCSAAPEVFREFASVKSIYSLPRRAWRHPISVVKTVMRARRVDYDLIIDPCPRSTSSRMATRLMHGARKLGFHSALKRAGVDISVDADTAPLHRGIAPVHLLRSALLSAEHFKHDTPSPSIALTEAERRFGRRKLRQLLQRPPSYPVIAVSLSASGAKRIDIVWWREMLKHFSPRVQKRIVEILPRSGPALLPDFPGYYSTDIRRIAAVIEAADCFVSADSGLMQLGAATNTPTVGLFKGIDQDNSSAYAHGSFGIFVDECSPIQAAREIAHRLDCMALSSRMEFETYVREE